MPMQSPVTVLTRLRIRLDLHDEIMEAFAELAELTREEPGCRSYNFYETDGAPGSIVFVQDWETRAAFEAHITRAHLQDIFERFGSEFLDEPVQSILVNSREHVTL